MDATVLSFRMKRWEASLGMVIRLGYGNNNSLTGPLARISDSVRMKWRIFFGVFVLQKNIPNSLKNNGSPCVGLNQFH